MLEEGILCKLLPKTFKQVDIDGTLTNPDSIRLVDSAQIELINSQKKMIQRAKRTMLQNELQKYETIIQLNERQYKNELRTLEQHFVRQHGNQTDIMDSLKSYLVHQTEQGLRNVASHATSFRIRSTRHFRRSSTAKNLIGVSPEVIVDVLNIPLNAAELSYLSRGKTYYFELLFLNQYRKHMFKDQVILDQIKVLFCHIDNVKNK
jgi:YHS domain-containing protein